MSEKSIRDRIADILWEVDESTIKSRYTWERCARYADALIAAGVIILPAQPEAVCGTCGGSGLSGYDVEPPYGPIEQLPCPDCHGTGKVKGEE